ncbi:MAG: hypothetical protein U9N09_04945 [Euryarchaeota archaeon]|nr:hypothetical protein [Euryarchaeota archaeon]
MKNSVSIYPTGIEQHHEPIASTAQWRRISRSISEGVPMARARDTKPNRGIVK